MSLDLPGMWGEWQGRFSRRGCVWSKLGGWRGRYYRRGKAETKPQRTEGHNASGDLCVAHFRWVGATGGKVGKVGQGRAAKALNDPPVSLDLPYRQWAITVGPREERVGCTFKKDYSEDIVSCCELRPNMWIILWKRLMSIDGMNLIQILESKVTEFLPRKAMTVSTHL